MKRIRKYAFVAAQKENLSSHKDKVGAEILVIEERDKVFYLNRYTKDGKLLSDTSHKSIKEAEKQSTHDYPDLILDWTEEEGIKDEIDEVLRTYKSIKEMDIVENSNETTVKIGNYEINGFVDFQRCQTCHSLRIYNEKYDKYFCAKCNIWLEESCSDPNCEYCRNLPEKPLPIGELA